MVRILLCNDDGIDAKGLAALEDAFFGADCELYIVAPSSQKSASSHSVTLHNSLVFSEVKNRKAKKAYAIDGTPADCVKFALLYLLKDIEFDVVISGINHGPNIGSDIMYSGTVAAASEAVFLGRKAIAISLNRHGADRALFDRAAAFLKQNIDFMCDIVPKNGLLNVNCPATLEYSGAKFVRAGINLYDDYFEEDITSSSYILKGKPHYNIIDDGSDVEAVLKNCVSITPLTMDRTDYAALKSLQSEEKKLKW